MTFAPTPRPQDFMFETHEGSAQQTTTGRELELLRKIKALVYEIQSLREQLDVVQRLRRAAE